jgi:hypothetical protein
MDLLKLTILRSNSINVRNGFAMRNSVTGPIGDRRQFHGRATGTREECIWKLIQPKSITLHITDIHQNLATKTLFLFGQPNVGTLKNS